MIMRNLLFYFFMGKSFSAVREGCEKLRFGWSASPFCFLGGVSGCFSASPFRSDSHDLSVFSLHLLGNQPCWRDNEFILLGSSCAQPSYPRLTGKMILKP